jgi:hypothetical protein
MAKTKETTRKRKAKPAAKTTRTAKKTVKKTTTKTKAAKPAAKKTRDKKVKRNRATAARAGDWKIGDLKGAEYNPRIITERRLQNMGDSYERFGDLSGIVFNRQSGKLVSGHQRITNFKARGYPTQIKTKPVGQDSHGTIEEGVLAAKSPKGIIRVPFRVVDWDDQKAEIAANIAANAHGGEFDKKKLANLMAELEIFDEGFEVNLIGLDEVTLKSLPKLDPMPGGTGVSSTTAGASGAPTAFDEYDADDMAEELEHTCPKCGYCF